MPISFKSFAEGCTPRLLKNPIRSTTVAGTFESKAVVYMKDIVLPEFDRNKRIDGQSALVFDGPCRYDVILGRDFLLKTGMEFDFGKKIVRWFGNSIPLRVSIPLNKEGRLQQQEAIESHLSDNENWDEFLDCYAIRDAHLGGRRVQSSD